VGRIFGGTSVNTVPSLCSIDIDYRLLPGESNGASSDVLRQRLAALGTEVVIDPPYLEASGMPGTKVAKPCQALASACNQAKWKPKFHTAHYATDGAIISTAGIPVAVFGPGSIELAHTKAECVPVRELELASAIIVALLTGP
jgi:acetylornithine deacetylase/succinyl-diaminopimelate desuccinylase-like protein